MKRLEISKILFVEETIALANIVRQELKTAGFKRPA